MLRSIHIENFRALREFRMSGLGRVNLLVGTNNCGKTSILEAIHILVAESTAPIRQSLARRGELDVRRRRLQVSHLFYGHRVEAGSGFLVRGSNDGVARQVEARVVARTENAQATQLTIEIPGQDPPDPQLELTSLLLRTAWTGGDVRSARPILLTRTGTAVSPWYDPATDKEPTQPVRLVTTSGISKDETMALLDGVVLSPEESMVVAALQIIEPTIERLAAVGRGQDPHDGEELGQILISVAGRRLPVGSMGDGIQRLLGLALALVGARGGVLLVDEIDTGLHYTVLTKMWRLVLDTAARLDVQVFATTHSRDCFEALGEVAQSERDSVSLQRIESGRAEAIAYTAGMLRQAAEHGIEVR